MGFSWPAGLKVLERGWLSANNILLWDSQTAALIDSGYVAHADQTLRLIRENLGERPLDFLLNTHLHSDHCGGNHALQSKYPSMETCIPPGLAEAVRLWDEDRLSYKPTGQNCPRFGFNALLQPGNELSLAGFHWQIHAAPGHDPHSVILFEAQHRILISADALWESGFGVVFPELEGISAFNDVGLTLDLIESLQPLHVIPGHGQAFHDLQTALNVARRKLNGYIQNPDKHAMYGAKVLIKFKMLEWGEVGQTTFAAWANEHSHLRSLHRLQCPEQDYAEWLRMVLAELVRSQALQLNDELIINL
jgi:glyoxylase-like metal-dependent hydrolase (beta-lactamase superfamily II)